MKNAKMDNVKIYYNYEKGILNLIKGSKKMSLHVYYFEEIKQNEAIYVEKGRNVTKKDIQKIFGIDSNIDIEPILALLENSKIPYIFLPPYSPDYSPIELLFNYVKSNYFK